MPVTVTLWEPDPDHVWVEPENVDKVTEDDYRYGVIWANPARVSGTPCFAGTRVPVRNLWDYLEGGETIAEFLDGFPGVTQEQVLAVLLLARNKLLEGLPPDTCHSD